MRVIVAIDQSENWKQLIESIVERSWPADTIFRIVTVLEPAEHSLNHSAGPKNNLAEKVLHDARELLSKKLPGCTVYSELRRGQAADELITVATNWMVDKIVLGSHGHNPNRLIPLTVAQFVTNNSHCSLDLVKLKPQNPAKSSA